MYEVYIQVPVNNSDFGNALRKAKSNRPADAAIAMFKAGQVQHGTRIYKEAFLEKIPPVYREAYALRKCIADRRYQRDNLRDFDFPENLTAVAKTHLRRIDRCPDAKSTSGLCINIAAF